MLAVFAVIACVIFGASTCAVESNGKYNHLSVLRRQHSAIVSATWSQVLNLIQTTWIISKLDIAMPPSLSGFFETSGGAFDMTSFRLGCGIHLPPLEYAVARAALLNVAPACVLAVAGGIFVIAKFCPRESAKWPRVPELCSSVVAVFLLFFMAIVDSAVNIGMATTTHPCGDITLRAFPYILVSDPEAATIRGISIVGTVLWCVGALVLICVILIRFRSHAHSLSFRRSTLSITIRYKKEYPWWTLVVLLQNILVAMSVTFFQRGDQQSIYLAFVLVIYFTLVSTFRPFFAPLAHYCELASCLGRVLIMMVAPVYDATGSGEEMMLLAVIMSYGAAGLCFTYSVVLFVRNRYMDDPSDLQQVCHDLEGRFAKFVFQDVDELVDVANQAAEASQEQFVWHSKLRQVQERSSTRGSVNFDLNCVVKESQQETSPPIVRC